MTSELSARPAGATLRPFRGLRFDSRRVDLASVTSAPLEPSDSVAVAAALSSDEHNIAWLIDPLLAATAAPQEATRVASRLASWRDAGTMRHDRIPALYVYGNRGASGTLLGLIAAVSLHDPSERVILPHEQVSEAAVARHVALLEATVAQPEPVVLVHRGSQALRSLLLEAAAGNPLVSFGDGTAEHTLWRLSDQRHLAAAAAAIAGQQLLIADGHHRYAAFRRYREARVQRDVAPWDFGLAMVVDGGDAGLTLGPVHKVVRGVDWDDVRATAGVELSPLPDARAATAYLSDVKASPARCVITDGATWLAASMGDRAGVTSLLKDTELAVTRLHDDWLPRWRVGSGDIDHVHEQARAVNYARRSGALAVLLPAPPLEMVFAAARRGQLLPPKATSFGPKPRIGLVLRHWPGDLDDLHVASPGAQVRMDAAGAGPG